MASRAGTALGRVVGLSHVGDARRVAQLALHQGQRAGAPGGRRGHRRRRRRTRQR